MENLTARRAIEVWRHFAYNYREGGVGSISAKISLRIRRWIHAEDRWWIYEKGLPTPPPEAPSGMKFGIVDAQELRRQEYFKALAFPEMIRNRIERGARCHGIFVEGKLVNVGWTDPRGLELDESTTLREDGVGGIFDCLTWEEHRGKGLYVDSLKLMMSSLSAAGLKKAWIAVDPGNVASIRGIEKAGFRNRYYLRRVRRWGRLSLHLEQPH